MNNQKLGRKPSATGLVKEAWHLRWLFAGLAAVIALATGSAAKGQNEIRDSAEVESFRSIALAIESPEYLKPRMSRWLAEIHSTPIGRRLFDDILSARHKLVIRHDPSSCLAAGWTWGRAGSSLWNGVGTEALIAFDFESPESGTHWAFGTDGNLIEFTAIQNVFHELVHAKHYMRGTFQPTRGEQQAIIEENLFRREYALAKGQKYSKRVHGKGEEPLRTSICGRERNQPFDEPWTAL